MSFKAAASLPLQNPGSCASDATKDAVTLGFQLLECERSRLEAE